MRIEFASQGNYYQYKNKCKYGMPVFRGVDINSGSKEENNSLLGKLNLNFDNKFKDGLKEVKRVFAHKKQSITGWFTGKKRRKLQEQELAAIDGFTKSQEIFSQEQDNVINLYKAQLEIMKKYNEKSDEVIALNDIIAREERIKEKSRIISDNKSGKQGFNSIGGYDAEKFVLTNEFINKLSYERAGEDIKLPNAILFFGPNGNGKTTFAKALAVSSCCEFEKAKAKGKEHRQQALMDDIIDKAEKAQEHFEKTRERTIILVDEFDGIANANSTVLPELKAFMQDCSENYHVTIFATTNNPLSISPEIRNATRMPIKVYLNPPNEDNIIAVLKHYLEVEGVNCANIDYNKLADKILEVNPEKAYNNSQLESICNNSIEDVDGEITTSDLEYQISKTEPGITKEDLVKFEKEKSEIVTNNKEEVYD